MGTRPRIQIVAGATMNFARSSPLLKRHFQRSPFAKVLTESASPGNFYSQVSTPDPSLPEGIGNSTVQGRAQKKNETKERKEEKKTGENAARERRGRFVVCMSGREGRDETNLNPELPWLPLARTQPVLLCTHTLAASTVNPPSPRVGLARS